VHNGVIVKSQIGKSGFGEVKGLCGGIIGQGDVYL